MYGLCLRYAKCREEANDMLQEGFIRVFKNLDKYEPRQALVFWIRRVMINACLEHIRRNKKHDVASNELLEEVLDSSMASIDVQNAKELIELIQQLPDDYRMVFNLYSIEGYSHKEIAEMLNISLSNSKVRLMRARAILQKQLEQQMSA